MKRVIWWLLLAVLLAGCQQPAEPVSCVAETELERLESELTKETVDMLELQEKLAMWYNLNLLEVHDADFREAYNAILFYTDGVMGSLEIPSQQIHLPIYHGTDAGKGVGHDPETAFPVGGTGNHPVLIMGNDSCRMAVGERFVIHILGQTLTYQVVAVRENWDTTPVTGVDYCSLILGNGYQILAVRTE